jgi:DNA-binding NarL/FixJ family response regulator
MNGLELIEVASDLASSKRAILKNLAVVAARHFSRRGAIAAYEWRDDRTFDRSTLSVERGDERFMLACEEVNRQAPEVVCKNLLFGESRFFYPLELRGAHLAIAAELGVLEIGALMCTTGRNMALGVTVHGGEIRHWSQKRRDYWGAVAAHLGAMWRLRQKLTLASDVVAELRPDGQLLYARSGADSPPARMALRRAVLQREVQRTRKRSADPCQLWPALVAGRWSLIDAFTAGGQRHVVAYENPRDSEQLRQLTAREASILGHALAGRSGKWIAVELGVSEPTVTRGLRQALRRIGLDNIAAVAMAQNRDFETVEAGLKVATSTVVTLDLTRLTSAERDVANSLLDGRSVHAIAARRRTSSRTIAHQIASIYRKLGIASRRELLTA